jgi:uroporphyrinogen decarboxylase
VIKIKSIDRVKAALKFTGPDRVPIWKFFGDSDVLSMFKMPSMKWQPGHDKSEENLFPHVIDDLIVKSKLWNWQKPEWANKSEYQKWLEITPREEIDEWGTIWKRAGINTMGHPSRPTLFNYNKLDEYIQKYTPIFDDAKCYSVFAKLSETMGKDKYRIASLDLGPLQIASQLRGFSTFLLDHRRNKKELKLLFEHLTEQFIKYEKMWIKFGNNPNGFILYDDLGEQKGPFFSPKLFTEFYKPVYARLIESAHELGCDFHLHCCGKIDPLIPLLIEWGLDALELDSPRMTGFPALNPFRGKIMMWGCINIQSIYPSGTPEEIEREVWHMIRNLGTPKGGFGAYFYPQESHIKVIKKNSDAFLEGLKKYGDYSKIPKNWWTYPIIEDWKDNIVPPLPPA